MRFPSPCSIPSPRLALLPPPLLPFTSIIFINHAPRHHVTPIFRYEVQDLHIQEVLPQMVAISEAYIQVFKRQQ